MERVSAIRGAESQTVTKISLERAVMCAEAALAESIICWPFNSTYNLTSVKAASIESSRYTDESLAIVLTDLGDMISQALNSMKLQIC